MSIKEENAFFSLGISAVYPRTHLAAAFIDVHQLFQDNQGLGFLKISSIFTPPSKLPPVPLRLLIKASLSLLIISVLTSCSRNDANPDNPDNPDNPNNPPASFVLDSVIYHTAYGHDEPVQEPGVDHSYDYKVWHFSPEPGGPGVVVDAYDSTTYYNGFSPMTRQTILYTNDYPIGDQRVIDIRSRNLNPDPTDPYGTRDYSNFRFTYSIYPGEMAPYRVTANSWFDFDHSIVNHEQVSWDLDINSLGLSDDGRDSFALYHAIGGGATQAMSFSIFNRDSVVLYSGGDEYYFLNWLQPSPDFSMAQRAKLVFSFADGSHQKLASFKAFDYKEVLGPTQYDLVPNYERSIRYSYDPDLLALTDAMGGGNYTHELPYLQLFYSDYQYKWDHTDLLNLNGTDWITRLRWGSLISTDTIFDVRNNQRIPLQICNTTSEITKDSRGRITKVVKRSSMPVLDRETLEFRYRD